MNDFPRIDALALHGRLKAPGEIALLDIREEGVFAGGHMLTASNAPFSRLERLILPLVPRLGTPIVLVDSDETLAARAADILGRAGYRDIAILKGGIAAWAEAGLPLFSGVFVPSKAFGEFVELECRTPHIDAADLATRLAEGKPTVLLDSRPFDEYRWITIPGALDCPGAELVLRAREAVTADDALVVVNCGGRTRSIIGAQTLIDAGLRNRVVSLKDGTQGWHLSGFTVERGAGRRVPLPGRSARAWAVAAARRLGDQLGVRQIDAATLDRFIAEQDETTLYRFDVRGLDEYLAGHRVGFAHATGGQLVQATDTFIAVREARIVLADSDGVRARTTAGWLLRMGFADVFVLDEDAPGASVEIGAAPETVPGLDGAPPASIDVTKLEALTISHDVVVVDFATSRQYGAGHIPGAWFAIRGRLASDAKKLPYAEQYALTSPDGVLARLAAEEFRRATGRAARVLEGGTAAWQARGLPLEPGASRLVSDTDDVFLKAFERKTGAESAMREYLDWEVGLVEQVRRDGSLGFRIGAPVSDDRATTINSGRPA